MPPVVSLILPVVTALLGAGVAYGALRQRLVGLEGRHAELAREAREGDSALRERLGRAEEALRSVREVVVELRVEVLGVKHTLERMESKFDRLLEARVTSR